MPTDPAFLEVTPLFRLQGISAVCGLPSLTFAFPLYLWLNIEYPVLISSELPHRHRHPM